MFALDQIEQWGDVALAIGRYTVQVPVKPGAFEVDRGKYVGHWRRMSDGQFRVTVSLWEQRPLAPPQPSITGFNT